VFHTNLEQIFKHTATDLNRQPTTTQQRLMCDSTTTGCCRLNDTGSKIEVLMWPHRKKSIGVRSGNLGDQATGLPRPIQRSLLSGSEKFSGPDWHSEPQIHRAGTTCFS